MFADDDKRAHDSEDGLMETAAEDAFDAEDEDEDEFTANAGKEEEEQWE